MRHTSQFLPLIRTSGFTLLELMVATALFSVLVAMAYAGLDSVMRARSATHDQAVRLGELQHAMGKLQQDVEQMINRPVRDELGDDQEAVMASVNDSIIELTRAGMGNWLGGKRSSLVRVTYRFEHGDLVRESWPVLDRVQDAVPQRQVLLSDVEDVEVRYHDGKEWSLVWPPQTEEVQNPLPNGVEFTLTLKQWGVIRRVFHIAG